MLRKILILALACVFLVSAGSFGIKYIDYKKGEELYEEAVQSFQTESQSSGFSVTEEEEDVNYSSLIPEITMDFDALAEINTDIIGWILIPGTNVNYPLLKGSDNDEYLRRAFNGVSSRMGSIFMDYRCASDFNDRHTIIYGHNMRNSTMFSRLLRYRDQTFYENHRYFYIYTPDGYMKYEIFSAYELTLPSEVFTIGFQTKEGFGEFLSGLTSSTLIASNIFPDGGKRVVTLSTCAEGSNDPERFVVHGVLVEDTRPLSMQPQWETES